MMKNFEDFQSVGKEQFDAAVASATALTKGMQTIATELADYSKKSFEDGSAVFEKALAAKSLDKAVDIQTSYAKSAYEAYIGQMTKIGEIYMSAAKEAYKPFESQIAELSGKVAGKKAS
jgi:phasin family protein